MHLKPFVCLLPLLLASPLRSETITVANATFAGTSTAAGWTDLEVGGGTVYYDPSEASATDNVAYLMSSGTSTSPNFVGIWQDLSASNPGLAAASHGEYTISFDAGFRDDLSQTGTVTLRVSLVDLGSDGIYQPGDAVLATKTFTRSGDGTAGQSPLVPETATLAFTSASPNKLGLVFLNENTGTTFQRSGMIDNVAVSAGVFVPVAGDATVAALLARQVPALSSRIAFESMAPAAGKEVFQVTNEGGKVLIRGSSTNSRAAGLRWYLAHDCGMHFSWSGDQLAVPSPLPLPSEPPRASPWKWRSAHNQCVFSYSMAFWDWPRWEKEVDFLALHGINQAFLLTGHEKIWQNTLRRLGFSDAQIATWLPSTSHLAWWQMDNLAGEGGPLTQHEIDNEAALARQVADRMRELGIEPVTQGFYGMVPSFFSTRFPTANVIAQGNWVANYTRPPVLDPSDPAFAQVAAIYYEEMQNILGPVKFYGGDLFHEGGNTGGLNLATAYKKIQDAMLLANPASVWVMFGWAGNPKTAGLTNLVPDRVLIQQTSMNLGTAAPYSGSFSGYGGVIPWTWNVIDNFGGNHGLYGNLDTIATLPSRFLNGGVPGNFAGLGHSPEAIETNPMQTALYYDMFWRDQNVEVGAWLDETVTARYGAANASARKAWDYLARSSYRCPVAQQGITDYVLGTRPQPGPARARIYAENTRYWCELDVLEAWKLLLDAAPALSGNPNYRYDLVDVTRHVLNFHSKNVCDGVIHAFNSRDRSAFDQGSAEFLRLFDDLDGVLGSDRNWLLGTWLAQARAKGNTAAAKDRIERNARNQITLWNGAQGELNDYASRSWSGLMGGYYKARWSRYLQDLRSGWMTTGLPAYTGAALETAFLNDHTPFPATPSGDTAALSRALYDRLAPSIRARASLRWSLDPESTADQVIRFDVTERYQTGKTHALTLARDLGNAATTFKRASLVTSGGTVIATDTTTASLSGTAVARTFPAAALPTGERLFLELVLTGPGNHAVANGPVTFAQVFIPTQQDYVGRFQYAAGGTVYWRELRADGTVGFYLNGVDSNTWAGYTWQFVNGEARLANASGTVFERHKLTGPNTLLFQVEPQYGPGIRVPASAFYQKWAIGRGLDYASSDPDADNDHDGRRNLDEFLFGTDPNVPDSAVIMTRPDAGTLRIGWRQRTQSALEAVRYQLQISDNLMDWQEWPDAPGSAVSQLSGYFEMHQDIPIEGTRRFIRARSIDR